MTAAAFQEGSTVRSSEPGPRLVIATASLSGSLEDKLVAAMATGFSSIELLANDLMLSALAPRQVRAEAARLQMSVEAFQPLHVEAVPRAHFEATVRRAERTFDIAEQLGARLVLLCSSMSPHGLDDDDLATAQLHELAARAALHGLRLAYEAVPWGRVSNHDHAWRLVDAVDHPNLGLCLDSFHVLSRNNDPASLGNMPPSKIFYVQLADAPVAHMDERAWSLHHRTYPGLGMLDVRGFVRRLLDLGYSGPMALEVFNDVHQQEDPRHAATGAMRSMLAFAESVTGVDEPRQRGQLFGMSLPAAPEPRGYAFAELAVDAVSAPVVAHALTALGFVHAQQHRSKDVQLWQQGSARLLLNLTAERAIEPGTAALSAVAVESPDPAASRSRAERLRAPQLPRRLNPHEKDLECVATPDGTALFFVTSTPNSGWLEDFAPTDASAAASSLLTKIDHVALTESIDDFDQTALFYRSLLGLVSGRTSEANAPFGVVRGWSAADPSHRLRVSLSTAPLRRGDWAPLVTSPQHIAFATDDALACARAMRASHAPILEIPDNYYNDLDARGEVATALLEELRQFSILYDRDENGEYLHFYTEMLGSRVFFEVVQRLGEYDGLGAASSTAVRMASHRRHRLRTLGSGPSESTSDSPHEYSLAHLTALSLSPPELVDAAASAGYRYVGLRLTKVTMEEPHYPLTYDPALMRATKTHLAATGVEVLDVELARLTSGDNPRDYLRFLEAGAELGARHVITQIPDADFSRKVHRFGELCELARPLGLTIDLEFPSWTETGDLTEAARVLREADQPNAGILVDLLHFARSQSSVEELRRLPREWFHFVHVCDAPGEIPSSTDELIHTARFERSFPGEGQINVHGILEALPDDIPYALEIPRARLAVQVGAKEHARLAITAARRHLDHSKARAV